ncbi:tumor necrosis factor receptor superfamily member 27 [Hyla sarda]|uniref:tumor necrosis factor receptor superfamily member 27 n=1 Tax=Hyla sarda TaxID=327740 RepID=UPI0024C28CFD|nr:tumor necrosis factor receptor superfamily member 27 [Hyla sarda]XP_056395773.1 tumor necrosis factor receptor superfamily member 27 [Hyla sarda]XP_056395774.1 tumor necrosis factor receptor superfamily member 27 [Hyla sarda]
MGAHFYQLIGILLIFKLDSSESADCLENEYEDKQGNCVPCKQCGPGYELSEECGSGRESLCLPCRPGRYKEDRGEHCLRCLNCAVINRSLKANCSLTSNSICGDCLPGFYSKTQIGGFRERECFPCTAHTPRTESQCYPKPGPPTSTTPPPQDPVLLVAVIMVALSLILVTLVTFSVICCGRFLKSQFQRAFRRSQDFAGQPGRLDDRQRESTNNSHGEQQVPKCCFGSPEISGQAKAATLEEVHVISKSITSNSCTVSTALCSLTPSVELCAIPSPPVKPHYSRSVSETQPLIRNSGCSDCFSGSAPASDPNQGVLEQLPLQAHSCASEKQHWSHAPVECTELDLENFSEDASQAHLGTNKKKPSLPTCSCPTPGGSSTQDETWDELVSCLDSTTLGLPISQIPDSLLVLLAHKLDTMTHGVQDFKDIGIALGVQPHLVDRMAGFRALHKYLSPNTSCTLLHLVRTLQRLQRRDAVAIICSHFSQ